MSLLEDKQMQQRVEGCKAAILASGFVPCHACRDQRRVESGDPLGLCAVCPNNSGWIAPEQRPENYGRRCPRCYDTKTVSLPWHDPGASLPCPLCRHCGDHDAVLSKVRIAQEALLRVALRSILQVHDSSDAAAESKEAMALLARAERVSQTTSIRYELYLPRVDDKPNPNLKVLRRALQGLNSADGNVQRVCSALCVELPQQQGDVANKDKY